MTHLNPYVHFRGNARTAMEFYQSIFGGELTVSTFGEFGMPGVSEAEQDQVMHAQIVTPGGLWLMGSDAPSHMPLTAGDSVTISLSGTDEAELRDFWAGLSTGADVQMELTPAPWGDTFGQLVDQFGVGWLVNIVGPQTTD